MFAGPSNFYLTLPAINFKLMSDNSVDIVFEKAIATVQTLSSAKGYHALPRPPASTRIQLYALFKQSTEGDVESVIQKPSGNSDSPEFVIALKKWETWKSKEGMSSTEAKKRYIQLLINTMKTYAMGTLAAREMLSELEFLWWQASHPKEGASDYGSEPESAVLLSNSDALDPQALKIKEQIYQTLLQERDSHFERLLRSKEVAPKDPGDVRDNDPFRRIKKRLSWLVWTLFKYTYKVFKRFIAYAILSVFLVGICKLKAGQEPLELHFAAGIAAPFSDTIDRSVFSQIRNYIWYAFQIINDQLGKYKLHSVYFRID
ncbi:acyl-CoA-binding domain-containing protein Ecym_5473 [Eremothecium cymbalariae DBVPG|uniref:ACB domain-containing protein n=1 Tax=Eremothecium cymbalariae (strain CBS 270.75 / DBVPG 7215 / KCTC 17166 / NRRL Y-17582) TaxID=931890 RepID=I6NDS8_ERECY|nr:hypothetical protein Ecym_5473 [Eremothecium cymbalariae DBVPG\